MLIKEDNLTAYECDQCHAKNNPLWKAVEDECYENMPERN